MVTPSDAAAEPDAASSSSPPYIDRVVWVNVEGLPTLRVYPSAAGREVSADPGKTAAQTAEAWAEVLAFAPDADTPTMQAQFRCHWRFAELAEPRKPSWNLEPWRPDVDDSTMVATGCNPGGPEKG